jgi:hypothetical protein
MSLTACVCICTHPCVCAVEHGVCQGQYVGTVYFFALQTRLRAVCLQQRHERSQRCFRARQRLSCGAAEAEAFLHGMLTQVVRHPSVATGSKLLGTEQPRRHAFHDFIIGRWRRHGGGSEGFSDADVGAASQAGATSPSL